MESRLASTKDHIDSIETRITVLEDHGVVTAQSMEEVIAELKERSRCRPTFNIILYNYTLLVKTHQPKKELKFTLQL